MVLADTSIGIEHLRHGEPALAGLLSDGLVLMHPFVSGELACGNLKDRPAILSDLQTLPQSKLASNAEVLHLIEDRRLWGRGLGWIDAQWGSGIQRMTAACQEAGLDVPKLEEVGVYFRGTISRARAGQPPADDTDQRILQLHPSGIGDLVPGWAPNGRM